MVALLPMPALAEESGVGEELDIPEIVLEHLADAYEWHIASYEGKHLSIPLPIIIRSENTGDWHFCTAHSLPDGFFFSEEHHGKIYEHMADGTEARPLDLSITKSVLQIWIVVIVLIVIFLSCASWYKKHDAKDEAPGGFVGMMEMIVMTIHDDLIKSSIGEKHYKPYAPCQQGILEGDILARGSSVPESLSRSGDACHRTLRSIHEALRADDPSLCQHDGWSRCDPEFHLCDFPRLVYGCRIWSWSERFQYHHAALYECA